MLAHLLAAHRGGTGPDDLETALAHAVRRAATDGEPGESGALFLALVGLDGVDELTRRTGRRWAEQQIVAAERALVAEAAADRRLRAVRAGALTYAVIITCTDLDGAFSICSHLGAAVMASTDSLAAPIGLAALDGHHADDPITLLIAADAALDQARGLGQAEVGPVCAAAPAGTGLRWLSSRAASTEPAAL